jgi:hypothetical protein
LLIANGCGPDLPEEVASALAALPDKIDFNHHIRPLLSDRCWPCHGPDNNARKADLRLDTEAGAFGPLAESDGQAFRPGSLAGSEAIRRITSDNPDFKMPPVKSNLSLTAREIAMIAKWIEQGAEWKAHWAFLPPVEPDVPQAGPERWLKHNAIDNFIHSKLQEKGLTPRRTAGKERLLRRVTMDLTGLPPTVPEIDAFLSDDAEDAYELVIDRLLQTDACAERLAMEWMDVARYADSHGMHADGWRMMWPWRDWVIDAFAENMPYDQFVTWQLAGDLMPNPTKEQILATAFHRNHPMTAEGGVIDEEFRVEYVADRANTTAKAFLGLTMECARCHDHKFDPISQKEYYRMSAFFNNVKELGMTGDDGNFGPMLLLSDEKTDEALLELRNRILKKERELEHLAARLRTEGKKTIEPAASLKSGLFGHFPMEKLQERTGENEDGKKRTGFSLDGQEIAIASHGITLTEGKSGKALRFVDEYATVSLAKTGLFEMTEPFSVSLSVKTVKRDSGKTQTLVGNTGNKNTFWRGWDFFLDDENRPSVRLIHSLPNNYIHVVARDSVQLSEWIHLSFSYDGSGKAQGVRIYLNGRTVDSEIVFDRLYKSILPVKSDHQPEERALRLGKSYRGHTGENGIFEGSLDELRIFGRTLTAAEAAILAGVDNRNALDLHYALNHEQYKSFLAELTALRVERLAIVDTIPEIMVMEEMPSPRPTFVLRRGLYDQPGEHVNVGTPEGVLGFPDELPKNRFGLAKWIFHEDNPLTARVAVNRYWQMLFGQGLVKTVHDFGSQGELPSHPELLNWLAVTFRESGWDVKALLKSMVMSATYQQDSALNPGLAEADPENVWLSRGPSYRLSAEMIRDNALAASGLLVRKIGGESVKPYQPPGLWIELGNFSHKLLHYKQDSLDNLYRRSIYTFIRRTSPPPYMTTFDAPNRDICTVRRERTNTPLQALILLNDPQFVEAARVLAERMQLEGGENLEDQVQFAFRSVTGRRPTEEESRIFENLFAQELQRFTAHPQAAEELLTVGDRPRDERLDKRRTAALAIVASTMLNHDEAYMKR